MAEDTLEDEKFMREALKEARKAFDSHEVPVGAVLVYEGKVVARGHNQVELLQDATAHAEMLTLTMGSSFLQNFRLLDTTLYSTLEPCVMCLGALFLSRVGRLVYGAKDIRQGGCGSWVNLLEKPHPIHTLKVTSGILEAEGRALLQNFFSQLRKERENEDG
jgi:tRNA(adenine34) deaminase